MINKKIILGGGISAKIFAFYNREYEIIGRKESATAVTEMQNFIEMQYHPLCLMFLKDIERISGNKIPYKFVNRQILYFDGKNYSADIKSEDKIKILEKKLTDINTKQKLEIKTKLFSDINFAQDVNGEYRIIVIDFNLLHKILDEIIHPQYICQENVKNIILAENKIITETNKQFIFEDCVSTIPLNIFYKLCNIDVALHSSDVYVRETTESELEIPEIPSDNAMVYFPEKNKIFTRVIKKDGKCFVDITGNPNDNKKYYIMKNARFSLHINKHIFNNIMFLGRFSEWNPNITLQDVIRKSSSKIQMQKIWENQKAFSSHFFDFKEDLHVLQNNIKEQSLLLMNEIFDLLGKINWKKHLQSEKKIEMQEIQEEWIDIFKYWLTIGVNLGITFDDFVKKYYSKSGRLQKKLLDGEIK